MQKRRRKRRSFWVDALQRNLNVQKLRNNVSLDQAHEYVPTTQNYGPRFTSTASDRNDGSKSPDLELTRSGDFTNFAPEPTTAVLSRPAESEIEGSRAVTVNPPTTTTDDPHSTQKERSEQNSAQYEERPPDLEACNVQMETILPEDGEDGSGDKDEFQPFREDDGRHRAVNSYDDNDEDEARRHNTTDQLCAISVATPSRTHDRLPDELSNPLLGTSDENNRVQEYQDSRHPEFEIEGSSLEDLLQIWRNKLTLTALFAVVGSARYTVKQYDYTRDILKDVGADLTWPTYATTQRYFERIIESCMPESDLVRLPKTSLGTRCNAHEGEDNSTFENARPELASNGNRRTSKRDFGTENVRIFRPSSWAKLDVASSVVFDQMYPSFGTNETTTHPLEGSTIVRDKESATNCCNRIFIKRGDRHIPCAPGTAVKVSVQNPEPVFEHTYQTAASEETYDIRSVTLATWTVGSEERDIDAAGNNANGGTLSPSGRAIVSNLSKAAAPIPDHDGDMIGVIPGDVCTLLSSGQNDNDIFAIVVHRFWKFQNGIPSVVLLWIRGPSPNTKAVTTEEADIQYLGTQVVEDIQIDQRSSSYRNHNTPDQGADHKPGSSSWGTLADGTPFVIYRILLYCDDFQKSSAAQPNGSAGGCYFLPMSLPPEARRNKSSVRIISLTPPGVPTNQVLHYIVDDLVNASVHGVRGHTPTGKAVKIFTDVCGFVGDYPASASAVDVVGRVGRAPCTVCSFRSLPMAGTEGSRYGYTTDVHANNSAFMRHGERHHSVRESGISDSDALVLGMVSEARYSDVTCPLLHFQRVLDIRKCRTDVTSEGVPAVCNTFDAFRCNVIAPDHLLTGLSKDVLNALFKSLPTNLLRMKAEDYICAALRENGLLTQNRIFNNKTKTIYSMTLSEIFCVLLVSVPTFKLISRECPPDHISQECYRLIRKLQRLVAFTYWWPLQELDWEQAVRMVHEDKDAFFSDLNNMCKDYVKDVEHVCGLSETAKEQLDKPNLHRLVELYEHTIPTFGHVREVMELVFESAHQPLKRCIARSNNHDAHLFAVEHSVGNDWQGRLAAMVRATASTNEETRTSASRGLRRLLLGEQADLLDEYHHSQVTKEIDLILQNLFTPALRKQLNMNDMISNYAVEQNPVWRARVRKGVRYLCGPMEVEEGDARNLLLVAKRWLQALYPSSPDLEGKSTEADEGTGLFQKARRVKVTDDGRQIGKPNGFDTISAQCCVQVYLDPSTSWNKVLKSSPSARGARLFFFAVIAILQRREGIPFALCIKCAKRGDEIRIVEQPNTRSFQLLCLTPDVRRIAIYHACKEEGRNICQWDAETRQVTHSNTLLRGGAYYFQTRGHGYPPRVA